MLEVLVVGAGTMGLQIAMQFARFGYEVRLFDKDDRAIDEGRRRLNTIANQWVTEKRIPAIELATMKSRIAWSSNPEDDFSNCALLVESVPEIPRIKTEVFTHFQDRIAQDAILVTNSSYLTPSMLLRGIRNPERFAAMHFHDPVWHANVVDIMPHSRTAPDVMQRLTTLAQTIDQIPIVCRKERVGYVFNAMLQAFLKTALELANSGIASYQDIDRAWMGVLKTEIGPFGILDRIGLDTVQSIAQFWSSSPKEGETRSSVAWIEQLTSQGKLGLKTGSGFYEYPNPAYQHRDFLMQSNVALGDIGSGDSGDL